MGKIGTKILVMLIEHDKYVRESLKIFFADSPIDLHIFKTAQEGLDALKTDTVDVVIF